MIISTEEAFDRLREGNRRYVLGLAKRDRNLSHLKRQQLAINPEPFAIVLGCSDSRVPTEIVFDQGSGDLFVVRVAGNIAGPTQLASIEFAALQFGIRLIVVLGHTHCGAVLATLDKLRSLENSTAHIANCIDSHIQPALQDLLNNSVVKDVDTLAQQAVRANINASVKSMRQYSRYHESLTKLEDLMVVGAEYVVETGEIEFLDVPEEIVAQKSQDRRLPTLRAG